MEDQNKVIITDEGRDFHIQCSKEEKMKDICNKYVSKINKNINTLIFMYGGKIMNLELTFNEQANSFDKSRNKMNTNAKNFFEFFF